MEGGGKGLFLIGFLFVLLFSFSIFLGKGYCFEFFGGRIHIWTVDDFLIDFCQGRQGPNNAVPNLTAALIILFTIKSGSK